MHIYDRLGVTRIVNARGAVTKFGGSLMPPVAYTAIREAGSAFVSIDDLLDRSGSHVAALLGVPAAHICSGAAGGLALCAAACLTGNHLEKIRSLPKTQGWANEVIVQRRNEHHYIHQCMESVGSKIVEVGDVDRLTFDQVGAALSSRTAAIQVCLGGPSIPTVASLAVLAKRAGVPLIVDAASEVPPRQNLYQPLQDGASLLVVSGGKGLRAPQNTGLIVGTSDLVRACRANGSPNDAIGRGMKVSKEDICAFVVCLEEFLSVDELDEVATYWRRATYLEHLLSSAARLSVSIKSAHPVTRQGLPRVFLSVDSGSRSASESLFNSMLNGNPAIVLGQYDDGLYIDPLMLDDNHVALIATRILSWVSAAADQSLK